MVRAALNGPPPGLAGTPSSAPTIRSIRLSPATRIMDRSRDSRTRLADTVLCQPVRSVSYGLRLSHTPRLLIRESHLGALLKSPQRQSRHHDRGDGQDGGDHIPDDGDRAAHARRGTAQRVGTEGVKAGPQDAASRVGHQEPGPAHPADPGEKRCEGPQYRDEPPEED